MSRTVIAVDAMGGDRAPDAVIEGAIQAARSLGVDVALAVLKKLVARGEIGPGQRVVVISTANGLKFTDFKIGYHEEQLPGIQSHHANRPITLPNDYDAVVRAIDHGAAVYGEHRSMGA